MRTVHIVIRGKVQGVFYRATAKTEGEKLGLKGWVRNTHEGDVEMVITGGEESVKRFIDWCWKGPKVAVVSAVQVTEQAIQPFDDFSIRS